MLRFVDTLNSLLRSLAAFVAAGVLGFGAWFGYSAYTGDQRRAEQLHEQAEEIKQQKHLLDSAQAELKTKDTEIATQRVDIEAKKVEIAQKAKEIQRLDTAVKLLKVDNRVAMLDVVKQERREDKLYTTVRFQELDPDSPEPLAAPREYEVEGDVVYVDAWVVKFDDDKVAAGDDPLRSASICLFRRLFGEAQEPQQGFPLDAVGKRPAPYAKGTEVTQMEEEIWTNFWDYANDPQKKKDAGLRAVHGEAPSIRLMPNKRYRLLLRSSGGLSIVSEDAPAVGPKG